MLCSWRVRALPRGGDVYGRTRHRAGVRLRARGNGREVYYAGVVREEDVVRGEIVYWRLVQVLRPVEGRIWFVVGARR